MAAHTLERSARIYVAGHRGLVGSAIMRTLEANGFGNVLGATRDQLDLRDQAAVNYWFKANRPEYVFLVAGTVGGILANSTRPAEFIYDNLMIHATVVHASRLHGVKRLLYLGSSCIYPRDCPQPITRRVSADRPARADQRALRDGQDLGHQARARRTASSTAATSSRRCRPTSTGRATTSTSTSSHVVPALMRKFHEAKIDGRAERRRVGHAARRCASSCTSTIWPTPACS